MQEATWRILLVDDDRDDHFWVREMLSLARGGKFLLDWAPTYQQGQEALQNEAYDAVLVDYDLGVYLGIDLIQAAVDRGYPAPIILLTGRGSYEVDVQAMQCGAADYLEKGEVNPGYLERSIRYAIERKRSQVSLAEANNRLAQANLELASKNQQLSGLFSHAPAGLALFDAQVPYRVLVHNEVYQFFFREPYYSAGLVGRCLEDYLSPADLSRILPVFEAVVNSGEGQTIYDFPMQDLPEGTTWWNWQLSPVTSNGKVTHLVHMAVDITKEHQARQSLEEREAHYRLLFESMLQGVVYQDRSGVIQAMNPAAEQILGFSAADFVGTTSDDAAPRTIRPDGSPFPGQEHPSMVALRTGLEVHGVVMGVYNPRLESYRWITIRAVPQFRPGDDTPYQVYTIFEDITEQRQLEERLRRNEQRLRGTFENAAVGIALVDLTGRFIRVNQRLSAITGFSREELAQKTFQEITLPEDLDKDLAQAERLLKGEIEQYTLEKRYYRKDGSIVWVNLTGSVQLDQQGQVEYFIAVIEDITQRKEMELELRASEQRFRIALSSVPLFAFTMDCNLRYTWVHNLPFGLTPEQALGKRDDEVFSSPALQKYIDMKQKVLETGQGLRQEVRDWSQGDWVYYYIHLEPMTGEHGEITGLSGAVLDITQQRRLEAIQADYSTQLEVQRRLIEQRELERMEVARDLHDGLLQELTALSFFIQDAIATDEKEARIAKLQEVQAMILDQSHQVRAFCNELRPPALAPFGLEKAIRSHIAAFCERNPGFQVHLSLSADRQILPETERMALFRIYQEALTNIAKHAQAQQVWIRLEVSPQEVALEVEDDGAGFEVPQDWAAQARSGHLGLLGMRERAAALGAEFELEARPGKGTRVRVAIVREDENVGAKHPAQ